MYDSNTIFHTAIYSKLQLVFFICDIRCVPLWYSLSYSTYSWKILGHWSSVARQYSLLTETHIFLGLLPCNQALQLHRLHFSKGLEQWVLIVHLILKGVSPQRAVVNIHQRSTSTIFTLPIINPLPCKLPIISVLRDNYLNHDFVNHLFVTLFFPIFNQLCIQLFLESQARFLRPSSRPRTRANSARS